AGRLRGPFHGGGPAARTAVAGPPLSVPGSRGQRLGGGPRSRRRAADRTVDHPFRKTLSASSGFCHTPRSRWTHQLLKGDTMRILHTSDWHIGRTLHKVSMLDAQRAALSQIAGIAAQERV